MKSARLVFIYSKTKFLAKLTKIFTGSYCYHVGWLVQNPTTKEEEFFDMNLLRRIRNWEGLYPNDRIKIVDSPVVVTWEYLYTATKLSSEVYGFVDYFLFALRPIYHLFGQSTRSAKGKICSEIVYDDLWNNGYWKIFKEVPSPADLERELIK